MQAQQAALNYASESPNAKRPSISKVIQFTDDTNDNSDTVIYNIEQDSGASPIQIVASSNPSIFLDPNFTNIHEHQLITSETEQQEECPISIIPAPTKNTTKATEQVQTDTTEYAATEKETIQVDQDTGNNLVVDDQLKDHRPPSVIFLDSPNGETEGPCNDPSPQPHTTTEIVKDATQAEPPTDPALTRKAPTATTSLYTTTYDSPSGASSVYATPPMSPYKRKNSDSCIIDV